MGIILYWIRLSFAFGGNSGKIWRMKKGFGLLELLVALAIVGLLWGGVRYFKQYQTESENAVGGMFDAKRQAEQTKALIEAPTVGLEDLARYTQPTLGE